MIRSGELTEAAVLAFRSNHVALLYKIIKDMGPSDLDHLIDGFLDAEGALE
jgi:hypothetical protein